MSSPIIGIDLGTTNSVVACVIDGKIRIIPVDGAQTMPSCVGIAPDGKILVGTEALRQYAVYPERTVKSIKRKMGTDTSVSLGEQSFTPEQISSLILKKLKQTAEQFLKQPVTRAVITVPAYFSESQRVATRNAGQMAGLMVERILNEPTAAALAYASQGGQCRTVLVYDLGGGTFDASLVVNEQGVMEVKASHGNTSLGGDDFDEMLVRHAATAFEQEHGTNPAQSAQSHNRLREIMEQAKIQLSDAPFVTVEEALLHDGRNLSIECARGDYEDMIVERIRETIECCQRCLQDMPIAPEQLDLILLAGGASRTPLVHAMIEAEFGILPRHEINPDLIVAMGAALQGSQLEGAKVGTILVDITPHDLGVLAVSGFLADKFFMPIIRRNSALPTAKSELFHTYVAGQKAVLVEVYQGVSQDYHENEFLGFLQVDGLDEDADENSEIIIKFVLNLNGMLEVTATEKHTGLHKTTLLNTARSEHAIPFQLPEPEPVTAHVADPGVDDLIKRAMRLATSGGLSEEDIVELKELMEAMTRAVASDDRAAQMQLAQELEDLLFYLEE